MNEAGHWSHQMPADAQLQLRMHSRLELTGQVLTDVHTAADQVALAWAQSAWPQNAGT
jgi:hypothetical protein